MTEVLKHILGFCGDSHINIVSGTLIIMVLNIILKAKLNGQHRN